MNHMNNNTHHERERLLKNKLEQQEKAKMALQSSGAVAQLSSTGAQTSSGAGGDIPTNLLMARGNWKTIQISNMGAAARAGRNLIADKIEVDEEGIHAFRNNLYADKAQKWNNWGPEGDDKDKTQ